MHLTEPFKSVAELAALLQRGIAAPHLWPAFERTLGAAFGHTLFTVLAFDAGNNRMRRVHSNRQDVSPTGGAKAVTDSSWTRHVLRDGKIFVGANKADLKVFSEHELLWSIGCESTLNIPVRKDGVTVGTLNLLDRAGQYDGYSMEAALVFAQFAADPLAGFLASAPAGPSDDVRLEHV